MLITPSKLNLQVEVSVIVKINAAFDVEVEHFRVDACTEVAVTSDGN
ncbi:MAG TPA: hypothetical protein VE732_01555 [Nitrososphaera sp.]|jgi:hypothetical protein|nr:hypothetical protein [Nitrososphaera sp.]